jgi:hypothetical protein
MSETLRRPISDPNWRLNWNSTRTGCRLQLASSASLLGLLLSAILAVPAQAQQASTPTQTPTVILSNQELAKSVHNPFADFVKVPIQSTTGFQLGRDHKVGDSVNIEPVVPFSLNSDWDLIAQPSLTVTYAPTPHEQSGLQDLQTSFFLTPAKATTWIWGVGPIFQLPTASSSELGTGRWSAGPTAALIYSEGPWFNGVLAYQLMSFAGNRERGSVNQTFLEPGVSYNFESGWYVQCEPSITYDWTVDTADAWTIPMGADIGKAFKIGSQNLSLQVGAYDLLKRPNGSPQWIARVSVTFLFPTGIK